MADSVERMLGEISGKLDSLSSNFDKYIAYHDKRHEKLDVTLAAHEADINQAKGAKTMALVLSAGVAAIAGWATSVFHPFR